MEKVFQIFISYGISSSSFVKLLENMYCKTKLSRVGWGNLGWWVIWFTFVIFLLIPLRSKQNRLTAGAVSMDCIRPLAIEISVASCSISLLLLDVREGRNIPTDISDFF